MARFSVDIYDPDLNFSYFQWVLASLDSENGTLPDDLMHVLHDEGLPREACRRHGLIARQMRDRIVLASDDSGDGNLHVLAAVLQGALRKYNSVTYVKVEASDPAVALFVTAKEISSLSLSEWLEDKACEHHANIETTCKPNQQ